MENIIQDRMTNMIGIQAVSGNLTVEEAKKLLHENAYIRTVAETLSRYCGIDRNDTGSLRKKATELLLEINPSAKKENVERKVRSWLNMKQQYISRESALQLAYALKLSVNDAEEFLWRISGENFHWRDPKDIAMLFALEKKMNYQDAIALCKRMMDVYLSAKGKDDDQHTMTNVIYQKVIQVKEENELESFIREFAPHLGKLHNTAFELFKKFMNTLQLAPAPVENNLPEARVMDAKEVVETYFYNKYIPRAQKGTERGNKDAFKDAIQRNIQQNWPDEFILSRINNREIDVTRKVLILLFLACDGGETDYGYPADGYYGEDAPQSIFDSSYTRLALMLNACGFLPLDPRTAFDWMVLYCITVNDILEIDENMANFLSEIFRDPIEEDFQEV